MVKCFTKMRTKAKRKGDADDAPEVEIICPFCLEEVKEGATRCPHCAGAFDKPAGE